MMYKVSYPCLIIFFLTIFNTFFYQKALGENPADKSFACPGIVTPIFSSEEICSGSFITVPTDEAILANVDNPESAIVVWDPDITTILFNLNSNCQANVVDFSYAIECLEDPGFSLPGGTHSVTVLPVVQAPSITPDPDCVYDLIPHCPGDVVEPNVVDPNLDVQEFTVTNALGCSAVFSVPLPACVEPIIVSDIDIIPNCNQYFVSFNISGGTGNYVVNGTPLAPGQVSFISASISCGLPYNFQVTDNLMEDIATISGIGPDCFSPLSTSSPVITLSGNQYQVLFLITGGQGTYSVDGYPLASNLYTSNFIDCGQAFTFLVSDACETIPVAGLPECFDDITVTDPTIIEDCTQYQAMITITGGTGNYIVNGTALPPGQHTLISPPIPCGTDYSFEVTDELETNIVVVDGNGPACLSPLANTTPTIDITNLEYQVSFSIQGGTGTYSVDGTQLETNNFVSNPIPCGMPYSFVVSDGCETFTIEDPAVECYESIAVNTQISSECSEYQVIMNLSGGTGNYLINGIPLTPGQSEFTSFPIVCGTDYTFQITDDIGTDLIEIGGSSTDCIEELSVSPETIEQEGNQYRISFTLANGTGNYIVNGQPFEGNDFVSSLIDCGQFYIFNISDSCQDTVLNGLLPDCLPPIIASDLEIVPNCDQFSVQFSLSGGSGTYFVNNVPLTGNSYTSPLQDCNTDYNFEISDDASTPPLTVSGEGAICNDSLSTSTVALAIVSGQYNVEFSISGGLGNYFIDDMMISGDQFFSSSIECGTPYDFTLTDGCDTISITGDSPCLPILSTSDIVFEQMCNQYIGQFTISGGSGDYSVNGNLITGDVFTTDLMDCETDYFFQVSDNQSPELLTVEGISPDCLPALDASNTIIEITENQFIVQISPSGGLGNYTVNDSILMGSTFTSDTISCGETYNFEISDGCESVNVSGGPSTCVPLSTTEVLIDQGCNQYTAQFSISGGSGFYTVNGTSISGDTFTSEPLDCGTAFNFDISDDQTLAVSNVAGDGPDCYDPFNISEVTFEVDGNNYRLLFSVIGGSGNYTVNGTDLSGENFISTPIDCNEPYTFEISDGCEAFSIEGDPIDCYEPLSVTNVTSTQICDQFTAQFNINGGSGNYLVNGTSVTDTSFVSELLECGTTVTLEVVDDITMESLTLVVNGPACLDSLIAEEIDVSIIGSQYTVLLNISGGTGDYFISDTPLLGNLYISDTIQCGSPYSFVFTDGCDTLTIEGDAPCDLCADVVGDFSLQLDQCHGEIPALPDDSEILASLNIPDFATLNWSGTPDAALEHPGGSCEPVSQNFALSIGCSLDPTINLSGGEVSISIHPEPEAPTIILMDSTAVNCICEVIPACPDETVEPAIFEVPNGTIGATFDISVFNQGCSDGSIYTVPVPDCILVAVKEQEENSLDLKIHHNPFGKGDNLGIQFTLPISQQVVLSVYDLNGRKVSILKNNEFGTGTHYVEWDGSTGNGEIVSPGMYLIELQTSKGRFVEKVMKYN